MPWWQSLALFAFTASDVTPLGAAADSLVTYILGYGVLGVVSIAFAWRLIVPARSADRQAEAARADLISERERILAELARTQEQRDKAVALAQEKLIPLLSSFVATSQSLLPLLQELVRQRGNHD